MQLLLEAGADILACETVPCLFEAQAMAKAVGEFEGALCWISFSCNSEATICDGTSIAVCAAAMDVFPQVAAHWHQLHASSPSAFFDPGGAYRFAQTNRRLSKFRRNI